MVTWPGFFLPRTLNFPHDRNFYVTASRFIVDLIKSGGTFIALLAFWCVAAPSVRQIRTHALWQKSRPYSIQLARDMHVRMWAASTHPLMASPAAAVSLCGRVCARYIQPGNYHLNASPAECSTSAHILATVLKCECKRLRERLSHLANTTFALELCSNCRRSLNICMRSPERSRAGFWAQQASGRWGLLPVYTGPQQLWPPK